MRRNQDQQEAEQTNQILVIDPKCFLEKEDIRVAEAKEQRTRTLKKTTGDEQREYAQEHPENV